jgi:hypothetical protein
MIVHTKMDPFDEKSEKKSEEMDIKIHNNAVLREFHNSSPPPLRKNLKPVSESDIVAVQKEIQKDRIKQLRRETEQFNKQFMIEYKKNPDVQRKVSADGQEGVSPVNWEKWVEVSKAWVLEQLINLHDKNSDDPMDVVTLIDLDKLKSRLFGPTWCNAAGTKKRRNKSKSRNKSKNKKKRMTRNRRN